MTSLSNLGMARRSRKVLLPVIMTTAVVLSACSEFHRLSSEEALVESTPALAHPIGFVGRKEFLDVETPPYHRGLSRNQYIDVYRFAVRYKQEATGPLSVSPPGGRGGEAVSRAAMDDVRRALEEAGVGAPQIQRGPPGQKHLLTLGYERPVAVAPECGNWPRDVGREPERVPYPDFGCSTQRNLAGMVANSRDLIVSQAETQASSERRSRVWSSYVSGDAAQNKSAGAQSATTDAKPAAATK